MDSGGNWHEFGENRNFRYKERQKSTMTFKHQNDTSAVPPCRAGPWARRTRPVPMALQLYWPQNSS